VADGWELELPFEVGDGWAEDKGDEVDWVVEGKGYYWAVVVLTLFVLGDVGDDGGEAEVGEVGEHEVDAQDYGLFSDLAGGVKGDGLYHSRYY
jgi:hypothetical protein